MILKRYPWRFAVGGLAIIAIVVLGTNPLRWSDNAVHDWVLRKVPVGSSQHQLRAVANTKGWRIEGSWKGYQAHSDWGGIDGATVVHVYLGHYQGLLRADLDSFWAFNENGTLDGVRIRRTFDGL